MPLKPLYRPSVKSASLIVRLCVAASLGASALLYFVPEVQSIPWAFEGVIALALLATVMGAWHDGHAIGEKKGRESGSALILILIAIVLFAGLTAIMNQGSRTSTGMVTDQQERLAATEVVSHANQVKQGVQRLLLRGCSENDLSFGNTIWTLVNGTPRHALDHNSNAPESGCSVFAASDGGVIPVVFPVEYTSGVQPFPTSTKLGHSIVLRLAMPGIGDADKEEIVLDTGRMNNDVCMSINDLLGVSNPQNQPPKCTVANSAIYNGDLGSTGVITDVDGVLSGKSAYCCNLGTQNDFLQVLHTR